MTPINPKASGFSIQNKEGSEATKIIENFANVILERARKQAISDRHSTVIMTIKDDDDEPLALLDKGLFFIAGMNRLMKKLEEKAQHDKNFDVSGKQAMKPSGPLFGVVNVEYNITITFASERKE
jgi:hypothetical protein